MTADPVFEVIEATWPARSLTCAGPWVLRDGAGGGKRVSSATAAAPVGADDLPLMEAGMQVLGQPPLVMIRPGEDGLDALLAEAGYRVVDPVVIYAAPSSALATEPPRLSTFLHWPRLAVAEEIWAAGGIGPTRLAVMDRASEPKAAILGRTDDSPAGAGFVAIHDGTAMLHALEVRPRFRRRGAGRLMIQAAAVWAQARGATDVALVVTEANLGARGLYASLGMTVTGRYHYRMKPAEEGPAR